MERSGSKGGIRRRWSRRSVVLTLIVVVLSVVGATAQAARPAAKPRVSAVASASVVPTVPLFAHYYLWWDAHHWRSKLGPNYPMNASPLPAPATLSSGGCLATSHFRGDTLVDIPARDLGLYSQDNPATFARHV